METLRETTLRHGASLWKHTTAATRFSTTIKPRVPRKDGVFQTGTNKYQIAGGTGKMKGIKGAGVCKLTGAADGSLDYSCSGEYTLAGAAPAKM